MNFSILLILMTFPGPWESCIFPLFSNFLLNYLHSKRKVLQILNSVLPGKVNPVDISDSPPAASEVVRIFYSLRTGVKLDELDNQLDES